MKMMSVNKGFIFVIAVYMYILCNPSYSQSNEHCDINHPGSDNQFIQYGDSSSTASLIQNIYCRGSGDIYNTYGDCSAPDMNHYIYVHGSGDTYLTYGDGSASVAGSREWPQTICNQGSGDLHVRFGSCSSSTSSMDRSIYNHGSGDIRIAYGNYKASKVTHTMVILGSGDIILRYANCSQRNAANCDFPTPNVRIEGSGRLYVKYGRS